MTFKTVVMAHPSAELYGADRIFAESVAALAHSGWRVVVALPDQGPLVAVLKEHGAHVVLCPTPVLRKSALRPAGLMRLVLTSFRAIPAMIRLLRTERPALVYVNTVTVPGWLLLARLFGHRVLCHVHEAEEGVPRFIQLALAAPLLTANTIVANSRATALALHKALPRLSNRVRLIYNGVTGPSDSHTPRTELIEPVQLVLVGRISPRKGTDIAIEAISKLNLAGRKVSLTIVGSVFSGYEWFERELQARIVEAKISDLVHFDGFHNDVWDSYRTADIALVPSRHEPFGNTSVEAQLAGTPVIVSGAQGLPETVHYGRYGVVVPTDDASALSTAIASIIDDWPAARHRATEASDWARQQFAPEKYRAEIVDLVQKLTRKPN